MTAIEQRFQKLAKSSPLAPDNGAINMAVMDFRTFVRSMSEMQGFVDYECSRLGADFVRKAGQRVIAAGANFTPVRIC